MSSTNELGNAVSGGSQDQMQALIARLRAKSDKILMWQLPAMLFRSVPNGPLVEVEQATDEQFQMFAVRTGIPINTAGIVHWSLEDRCRFIAHGMRAVVLIESQEDAQAAASNNSEVVILSELKAELFAGGESAQEAQA